jgi:hypothetical protein
MRNPRNFHHVEQRNGKIIRALTICYTLERTETDTWVLRYGATIYRFANDTWGKKMHSLKALDRYNKNPVVVNFGGMPSPKFYQYRRLEQFIKDTLIFKCGVEGGEYDYTENTGEIFDLNLTDTEKTNLREYVKTLETNSKNRQFLENFLLVCFGSMWAINAYYLWIRWDKIKFF